MPGLATVDLVLGGLETRYKLVFKVLKNLEWKIKKNLKV